jgi:toxin-antitoxin system PIN domain toxin
LILLDVNVVVAAEREDHSDHGLVRPWFDELLAGDEQFSVPDIVWASFVRIVTSGRIFEVPMPIDEAFAFLRAVRSHPNHVAVAPGEAHLAIFEELCRRYDAKADLVPDAYLAAIALEQGCVVASFDRDFARFTDLDWVIPGSSG